MTSSSTQSLSNQPSVVRNFLVLFLSNTLGQLLFFGGTIVIARSVGTVAFGWWGFAQAVFGYLLRAGEFGLEVTGIRTIGRDPSAAPRRVGGVLVIRVAFAVILCAGAACVAYSGLLPAASVPLVIVFSLGLLPVAVSLEWLFEGLQTPLLSGVARIVKGLLFFVLVAWLVAGSEDLTLSVWLYVVSLAGPALLLLVLGWRRVHHFDFSMDRRSAVAMLRESVPIGVATLLSQYSLFFGTIYLGYAAIGDELGLFTASHRLVIFFWAYGLVASNRVLLPRLSYLYGQARAQFDRFIRSGGRALLILSMPIGLGGSLLAPVVIAICYGPAFAGSAIVFQILIWALVVAIVGSVFEVGLIASDRQQTYLRGRIIAAALHTVAVPVGWAVAGISGVAVGMVCAETCYVVFVIIRSGASGLLPFLRQSWKIILAGGIGLASSQMAVGSPILMTAIALVCYAGALLLLREVTSGDVKDFALLLGLGRSTEERSSLHLVINALSVTSGGGLISWLHLLPALQRLHPEMEYTVLVTRHNAHLFDRLPAAIHRKTVGGMPSRAYLLKLLEQIVVPVQLLKLDADWVFGLGNTGIVCSPCPVFLNLENANPYSALSIPWPFYQRVRLRVVRFLGGVSARRATVVRFLSENSRSLVCARGGVPRSKSVVIPHGVDLPRRTLGAEPTVNVPPPPFLLTVTNLFPHKNVHTLLEAFVILVRRHAYTGSLVIAGGSLDREYVDSLHSIVASAQLDGRVRFIGWVDPDNLQAFYASAECFVFPSAEETFGMPVLEALASGTPVVVPSLRLTGEGCFIPYEEICGEAAVYCNAFDPEDMAERIQEVISRPGCRRELAEAGRVRARQFGWDRVAREIFAAIHEKTGT